MLSPDEMKEIFRHKTAGMELTTFSLRIRDPPPSSFQMSIKYFGSRYRDMSGSVVVLIRADVAPKACQILRRYVENDYHFTVDHTVGRSTDAKRGLVRCIRRMIGDRCGSLSQVIKLSQEESTDVEKQSGLWVVSQSVLLSFSENGPRLLISNGMEQPLIGQQPDISLMEGKADQLPGIVVGKVLSVSPEHVANFQKTLLGFFSNVPLSRRISYLFASFFCLRLPDSVFSRSL